MRNEENNSLQNIGHIARRAGCLVVHCAACGRGLGTPRGVNDKAIAAEKLREIGWSDSIDGLWRCPLHAVTEGGVSDA